MLRGLSVWSVDLNLFSPNRARTSLPGDGSLAGDRLRQVRRGLCRLEAALHTLPSVSAFILLVWYIVYVEDEQHNTPLSPGIPSFGPYMSDLHSAAASSDDANRPRGLADGELDFPRSAPD